QPLAYDLPRAVDHEIFERAPADSAENGGGRDEHEGAGLTRRRAAHNEKFGANGHRFARKESGDVRGAQSHGWAVLARWWVGHTHPCSRPARRRETCSPDSAPSPPLPLREGIEGRGEPGVIISPL